MELDGASPDVPSSIAKIFFSAHQEIRLKVSSISGESGSARPKNFGSAETMLSDFSPNKFGRSKIRHQFPCPLSHASHSLKPVAWTEKS
jgi:hypothetical protein